MQILSGTAIQYVIKAVAIRCQQQLARFSFVRDVNQDRSLSRIPIHDIVGRELKVPLQLSCVRVNSDNTLRVEVVSFTHIAIEIRGGITNSPIKKIEFGVVATGHPGSA